MDVKRLLKLTLLMTVGATMLGGVLGVLLSYGFIVGAYMMSLFLAVLMMLISIFYMIGSPSKRLDFFRHKGYLDSSVKDTLFDALGPILMAIWFMCYGFFLEALLH